MNIVIEGLGWMGMILVVLAYLLNSYGMLEGTSRTYQVVNLVAAVGMGANVYYHKAWPSFAVQVIWGVIALTALVKFALRPESQ